MSRLDLHVYTDAADKRRWSAIANGNILADSGQGYSRRIDALHGFDRLTGFVWNITSRGYWEKVVTGPRYEAHLVAPDVVDPCRFHGGRCQVWRCWS